MRTGYSAWFIEAIHEDVKEWIDSKWDNPATHGNGQLIVVGERFYKEYDEANVINLEQYGLDETGENGLTGEQLITHVMGLLTGEKTGKEIWLSKAQGQYLFNTIFKPADEPV